MREKEPPRGVWAEESARVCVQERGNEPKVGEGCPGGGGAW